MAASKTYIQQLYFNGVSYTRGTIVELYDKFDICCTDIPFKKNPEPKEVATRDWKDQNGLDAFIPSGALPVKSYDLDVEIICYEQNLTLLRQNITNFIDFLYGRIKADSNDTVQCGRLLLYNDLVGMGRKDVMIKSVDPNIFFATDTDDDRVATFKITFTVLDPVTEVTPVYTNGVITGFNF